MLTIVVTTVGWPTFLALQRASLDRFLTDEYQLIAVVDTPTASGPINLWGAEPRSEVIRVAREFVDEVLEMPEDLHTGGPRRKRDLFRRNVFHPSSRHGETLDFTWSWLLDRMEGSVLILDADMLLVAPNAGSALLEDAWMAAVRQSRMTKSHKQIDYVWPGLLLADLQRMPEPRSVKWGIRETNGAHLDTGGETSYWLDALSGEQRDEISWIQHRPSLQWQIDDSEVTLDSGMKEFLRNDDRNIDGKVFAELYDNCWLHFRAGSNWRNESADTVLARRRAFESAMTN